MICQRCVTEQRDTANLFRLIRRILVCFYLNLCVRQFNEQWQLEIGNIRVKDEDSNLCINHNIIDKANICVHRTK